jgi:HAD superfamily hydrolase (TIGR01459 family)
VNSYEDIAYEARQIELSEAPYHARTASTRFSMGLGSLVRRYDVFLVDQWGVLHDGHAPYPGVVQCLKRLVWSGKQVIIISNSGKRSACNEARLNKLGFPRSSYSHLVTSGEIAWQMLATGRGFFRKFMNTPSLLLTSDKPEAFVQGLAVPFVDHVKDAGMILLAGIDDTRSPAFYEAIIKEGTARKLPLVCTNPDLTRITSSGLQPGTGAIAQAYQARGGRVYFIGKPYPEIYRHCLTLVPNVPVSRVLAVGDSIDHDVAGGMSAGLGTLLTLRGVHIDNFIDTLDPSEINQRIRGIAGPFGAIPDWAIPSFRW